MIRVCDDHGYVDGESCPLCDDAGRVLLEEQRRVRLSKFVSGALRHFPDDAGLSLDDRGWVLEDELVAVVGKKYSWATAEHVVAVIATDPKGRFERHGGRVRAAYGHSVDVTLDSTVGDIPDVLFHGTALQNREAIAEDGLKPMGRQQVHLSGTRASARDVGRRHAETPILFVVDAKAMKQAGFEIAKRGTDTYTTDSVPPRYLDVVEGLDDE